jgi:hypothetical protein
MKRNVVQRKQADRFTEILGELADLHAKKAKDYGSDEDPLANIRASAEFGVRPVVGALVRLNDKVHRLKRFAARGNLANESAQDSIKDIAVYAVIAQQLLEEEEESV